MGAPISIIFEFLKTSRQGLKQTPVNFLGLENSKPSKNPHKDWGYLKNLVQNSSDFSFRVSCFAVPSFHISVPLFITVFFLGTPLLENILCMLSSYAPAPTNYSKKSENISI